MPWLSKGVDALLKKVGDNPQREVEVLVIGSGYGGAVAALRLAEAGYDVHVLERGNERVPGEFPNDLSNLARHVRFERVDAPDVTGPRDGLFDIRLHKEVMTLVGNALGGTSQINANVAIAPDLELFREKPWPKALRDDAACLPRYFDLVKTTLGVSTYGERRPAKAQALKRLEQPLRKSLTPFWKLGKRPSVEFCDADLAVNLNGGVNGANVTQGACSGCGDCVTGCNEGAKNTLTMNYLPRAYQAGAEFYTGAMVLAIEPDDNGATVYLTHTAFAHPDVCKPDRAAFLKAVQEKQIFAVRAHFAVLAAGALGSTEILQRSVELRFLEGSECLGRSFSGNGDGLHFGFDQTEEVNAIGWGAHRGRYSGGKQTAPPGPTIVSLLDVRTGPHPSDRRLIQDGILPGPLAHVTHEALTTLAALTQLDSSSMRSNDGDPLALHDKAFRHTQVYLAMGHDDAKGVVQLTKDGRAFVSWENAADQSCYKWQEKALSGASELGALFLQNPVLYPLPKAIANTLSGPPIRGRVLIVHPLGGCPMGESYADSVVNDVGAVHRPNRKPYNTLYVWDGSIVPGSIGVNPFLTITALAERAAERLIRSRPEGIRNPRRRPLPRSDPRVPRPADVPSGREIVLKYKETLRGRLHWGSERVDAALRLEMKFNHLVDIMSTPNHCVESVCGVLQFAKGEFRVTGGSVKLLAPEQRSWVNVQWARLRTLAVWFFKRGLADLLLQLRRPGELIRQLWNSNGMWKLAKHASETRRMRYELSLESREKKRYKLVGTKVMRYGLRSNLWDSLLDLDTEITSEATGERLARGRLRLDLLAFSEDNTAQLSAASDLPNALGALASLPLFFLRVILKLHLWDFRLPEYPPARWHTRRAPRRGLPEARSQELPVPAGNVKGGGSIPLRLTRFGPGNSSRTPILLLHGYAQSSYAFLGPELQVDFVRHLLAQGFDVWALDYRTSTDLPTNNEQCTLDDVGRYDIPHAVDRILHATGRKRVMAFGHCMGAATLAMSLLSGKLRDGAGKSKISAAVFSQVPPFIVGGFYSQYRRQVAAFWRDVVRAPGIDLAAKENPGNVEAVMDRLFATLPYAVEHTPYGERFVQDCSQVSLGPWPRRDIATCRRVYGLIGPLYLHENMKRTHALLHRYFGYGSVSVLTQVAKFFEYERLVTAEGSNIYVTDDNIRNHLDMPVGLLHGKRNQVFDPESAERSELSIRNARGRNIPCERIDIPANYAHFDCLAGDRAYEEVFPEVSAFLRRFANG